MSAFHQSDTSLHLWLDDPHDPAMPGHVKAIISLMRGRGFTLEPDMAVDPVIRAGHYIGRKGNLECAVAHHGRHLEIEFFQNIVRKNSNGGRYDFDKRQKMPYLIGKQFELERAKIAALMDKAGLPLTIEPERHGIDLINHRRAELSRQHRGIYERPQPAYNASSADKTSMLSDGAAVHFLGYDKRWNAGQAFANINNMWWVLLPCGGVRNMGSYELHLQRPACLQGRHFPADEARRRQLEAQHRAVRAGDTRRVEILRDLLTPKDGYYVISLHHTGKKDRFITMWGQDGRGYCWSLSGAGKYDSTEIIEHLDHYNSGRNIAVDAETVERLASLSDTNCRAIEPGTPRTAVLLNTPAVWYRLLANTIAKPAYEPLPDLFKQTAKKPRRRKAA